MGGEDIATARLAYGVKVPSASLFCASLAWSEVEGAVRALALIRNRRSRGSLREEKTDCGAEKVDKTGVERVPVEVLDLIRGALLVEARTTAVDLEARFLRRTVCGKCPSSKSKKKPLPRWFDYRGFVSRQQNWTGCVECSEKGREAMKRVYEHNISPFLAAYGLETEWRKWPSCSTDAEFSENYRPRKEVPSLVDLRWLRSQRDDTMEESDSDEEVEIKGWNGVMTKYRQRVKAPKARKRSPRSIVLLEPALDQQTAGHLPPHLVQGSWCRYLYHVEYSRTLRLEDLQVLERSKPAYSTFFQDWDVSAGDEYSGKVPGIVLKFVMEPYGGNRSDEDD